MSSKTFEKGATYENVYLVFIDASGHSEIVKNNPADLATSAFNLLYKRLAERLSEKAREERCTHAVVWSWLGDGGMIAIYDERETVARNTSINFAVDFLSLDLQNLQNEFNHKDINGDLHIRIAIHKGTITYTDEGQQGLIHSSDINWGAHLEKATPQDCISISEDIYRSLSVRQRECFSPVGEYEGRKVYLTDASSNPMMLQRAWYVMHGFQNSEMIQFYHERLSQQQKADLINTSQKSVIDFGTTLNTCSDYLVSTSRPEPYRDAILRLLKNGGTFFCYMLAPYSIGAQQLTELRKENIEEKIERTMQRFKTFKTRHSSITDNFHVFQYEMNPNFATMFFDLNCKNSMCLYSPYMNIETSVGGVFARADMPHYLVTQNSAAYELIKGITCKYMESAKKVL